MSKLTFCSSPALVPSPSSENLECILCEQKLSFRIMNNQKGPGDFIADKHKLIHTLDLTIKLLDHRNMPSFLTSHFQSVLAAIHPEIESDLHIGEYIQRTVVKEVRFQYYRRSL